MALIEGRGVAFVGTRDRARARHFYAETLALPIVDDDAFGMTFALGAGFLRVTELPAFAAGPHPVAGWDVADIRAAAEALKEAGIACAIYEGMGQDSLGIWSAPGGTTRLAWFADPDGNVLSLSQTGWSARA